MIATKKDCIAVLFASPNYKYTTLNTDENGAVVGNYKVSVLILFNVCTTHNLASAKIVTYEQVVGVNKSSEQPYNFCQ